MNKMTTEHKKTVEEFVTKMNHEINVELNRSKNPEEVIIERVTRKWYRHLNNTLKGISHNEVKDAMMKEIRRQEKLGLDLIA